MLAYSVFSGRLLGQSLDQVEPVPACITLSLYSGAVDAWVIHGVPDTVRSGLLVMFEIEPTLTGEQIARLIDLYLDDFNRVLDASIVVRVAHRQVMRLTPVGQDMMSRLSECIMSTSLSWASRKLA